MYLNWTGQNMIEKHAEKQIPDPGHHATARLSVWGEQNSQWMVPTLVKHQLNQHVKRQFGNWSLKWNVWRLRCSFWAVAGAVSRRLADLQAKSPRHSLGLAAVKGRIQVSKTWMNSSYIWLPFLPIEFCYTNEIRSCNTCVQSVLFSSKTV